LNPIEVASVHGSGRFTLTDRVKFAFNYIQDTWSGATPIGTAPVESFAANPRYNKNGTLMGAVATSINDKTLAGASPYAEPVFGSFYPHYIDKKFKAGDPSCAAYTLRKDGYRALIRLAKS
jgi:hypothetical protein